MATYNWGIVIELSSGTIDEYTFTSYKECKELYKSLREQGYSYSQISVQDNFGVITHQLEDQYKA